MSNKSTIHLPKSTASWCDFIADAEQAIAKAKVRIARLEGSIGLAKRKQAAGEPFPVLIIPKGRN